MRSLGQDLSTKIWLAKQKVEKHEQSKKVRVEKAELSESEKKHLDPKLPASNPLKLTEHDLEIATALGQGDPTKGISLALRKVIQFEEVMFEI